MSIIEYFKRTGYNGYSYISTIGKGSYGEVWLTRHSDDNKKYVLKKIDVSRASAKERKAAELESKLLFRLKHPNIVTYRDSFEFRQNLFIGMGFCEGGDLYNRLKSQLGIPLNERQVVEWFVQITMALQYMHDKNILHRDLKTQNIFLTKSKIIKVGDLGIARVLESSQDMATTLIGTPYYMSPELFSNKPYNHKSDIWALGCCVYEMATLKHAFNARDFSSLSYKILKGKIPDMPNQYSSELLEIIRSMLDQNADKRPSVNKILRNIYIRRHIQIFLEGTKRQPRNNSTPSSATPLRPQRESSAESNSNDNTSPSVKVPNRKHVDSIILVQQQQNKRLPVRAEPAPEPEPREPPPVDATPPISNNNNLPASPKQKTELEQQVADRVLPVLKKKPSPARGLVRSRPHSASSSRDEERGACGGQPVRRSDESSASEISSPSDGIPKRSSARQRFTAGKKKTPASPVPPVPEAGASPSANPMKTIERVHRIVLVQKDSAQHRRHNSDSTDLYSSPKVLPSRLNSEDGKKRQLPLLVRKKSSNDSDGQKDSSTETLTGESDLTNGEKSPVPKEEEELTEVIDMMTATLKMKSHAAAGVAIPTRKSAEGGAARKMSFDDSDVGPTEKQEDTIGRTTVFNKRMTDLRQEIITELGIDVMKEAYDVLDNDIDDVEYDVHLQRVLKGDLFEKYSAKIWQLKYWEDSNFKF